MTQAMHDTPGGNAHTVAVDPATHRVFFPLKTGPDGTPVLRNMRPGGTLRVACSASVAGYCRGAVGA